MKKIISTLEISDTDNQRFKLLKKSITGLARLEEIFTGMSDLHTQIAPYLGANFNAETGITTFVLYAPHLKTSARPEPELKLKIYLPLENGSYVCREQSLQILPNSVVHYTALKGLQPMRGNDYGYLYQLEDTSSGEVFPDPSSEYLPGGPQGKVSAVIDHSHFKWGPNENNWLEKEHDIFHIKKIHPGLATKEADFKGLGKALQTLDDIIEDTDIKITRKFFTNNFNIPNALLEKFWQYLSTHCLLDANEQLCITEDADYEKIEQSLAAFFPDLKTKILSLIIQSISLLGMDTVELFPANEYSSRPANNINLHNNILTITVDKTAFGSWGYDSNGFFRSLSALYGKPDDFKEFVKTCHERGIKVSVDLQLNHLGPEGAMADRLYPINHPDQNKKTDWGSAINYDDPFIRSMVLQSVKSFLENYHIDAMRLDMTQFIMDDSFLKDLGHLLINHTIIRNNEKIIISKKIPSHAEDAREDFSSVVSPLDYRHSNVWFFKLLHLAEDLLKLNRLENLSEITRLLLDEIRTVINHTQHDRQGNWGGFLLRNLKMLMMFCVGRGIPLEFSNNYFQFYRDLEVNLDEYVLLAEKIGAIQEFKEKDWEVFPDTIKNIFPNLDSLKSFAGKMQAWYYFQQEKYMKDKPKSERHYVRKQLIEGLIKIDTFHEELGINPARDIPLITKYYNRLIYDLSKDRSFNSNIRYEIFLYRMRLLRKRYPWLLSCESKHDFNLTNFNESFRNIAIIGRANPLNPEEQVLSVTNWDNKERIVKFTNGHKLTPGEYRVYASN
ncbi:MAG: alpha-amylase family glycosyl hydrolase, partial [Candidatus Margulisbacteria bacterium]|nr:alpha-amylase family glycosyl hydrolase [Candidatus Margulisiibacteriota bacterium]